MGNWSEQDLDRIGRSEELRIASRRPDGSIRAFVTIWAVRVGDDIFVRSAHGGENPWFARARRAGVGRISVGGVEEDVVFEEVPPTESTLHEMIDGAYWEKYRDQNPAYVTPVVGDIAATATLRVRPTDAR